MSWNWQQKEWPHFRYDKSALEALEAQFLHQSGIEVGTLKHINSTDKNNLIVTLMADEALKTSEIEGEYLDRDSLQASVRRQFGLDADYRRVPPAERGIAEMMIDLYRNFAEPLSDEILFQWHKMITAGRRGLKDFGRYRTHEEPMQVVSGPIHNPKVHFEAPPSRKMAHEMKQFIKWFNATGPQGKEPLKALTRAGIAHLYFVSIHPFEDGNGRVGRAISEKALSQRLGQAAPNALSEIITRHKKKYYEMLERHNKENEITKWLIYFSNVVLNAQAHTQAMINFIIKKTKFYDEHKDTLNERQSKAIARIFREGPGGFGGGLSARNYITITGAPRATATRDLQDLVQKEILRREGELKSTRYYLK